MRITIRVLKREGQRGPMVLVLNLNAILPLSRSALFLSDLDDLLQSCPTLRQLSAFIVDVSVVAEEKGVHSEVRLHLYSSAKAAAVLSSLTGVVLEGLV